jgi:hypothetical protein
VTDRRPSIWSVLTDAEHAVVVRRLLRVRPDLREEARRIATSLLTQTKRSEIASEVRQAVEAVSTADVAAVRDASAVEGTSRRTQSPGNC